MEIDEESNAEETNLRKKLFEYVALCENYERRLDIRVKTIEFLTQKIIDLENRWNKRSAKLEIIMGSVKQDEIRRMDTHRELCAAAPPCDRCGGEVDDPDEGKCDWCNHMTDKDD